MKIACGTAFKCRITRLQQDYMNTVIDDFYDLYFDRVNIGSDFVAVFFPENNPHLLNIVEQTFGISIDRTCFKPFMFLYDDNRTVGVTEYNYDRLPCSNSFRQKEVHP